MTPLRPATDARAVALFQQADMFDPSYQPTWDVSAFRPLVQALVDERFAFDGLTRVTVEGKSNNTNFLQVTANRPGAADVLSWVRVPYASQP